MFSNLSSVLDGFEMVDNCFPITILCGAYYKIVGVVFILDLEISLAVNDIHTDIGILLLLCISDARLIAFVKDVNIVNAVGAFKHCDKH